MTLSLFQKFLSILRLAMMCCIYIYVYIGLKCRSPKVELQFCSFLGCVHFSTASTNKKKINKTFYTMLKFLKCTRLISQNIAYFSTCKKPLNFEKFEQNCRSQVERKLSVFRKILNILRLARMFYIIYIQKIFDWSKNE